MCASHSHPGPGGETKAYTEELSCLCQGCLGEWTAGHGLHGPTPGSGGQCRGRCGGAGPASVPACGLVAPGVLGACSEAALFGRNQHKVGCTDPFWMCRPMLLQLSCYRKALGQPCPTP